MTLAIKQTVKVAYIVLQYKGSHSHFHDCHDSKHFGSWVFGLGAPLGTILWEINHFCCDWGQFFHSNLAEDLEASVTAFGAEGLINQTGLCEAVAKMCGGSCCVPTSQCARVVSREALRDLIYRRSGQQLYSPAAAISKALDQRPANPQKQMPSLSPLQARLLNHFRALAADDTGSFFALPTSEFVKCGDAWWLNVGNCPVGLFTAQ